MTGATQFPHSMRWDAPKYALTLHGIGERASDAQTARLKLPRTYFHGCMPKVVKIHYTHWITFNGYWQLCIQGVKRPGRDADYSPLPIAEVKNEWSYTSTPPLCLPGIHTDNFVFSWLTTWCLRVVPVHTIKAHRGVEVQLHLFLILALHGERSASRPGGFASGESGPVTNPVKGWLVPTVGLDP